MPSLTVKLEGKLEGVELMVSGQRVGFAGSTSVTLELPPGIHPYEVEVGGIHYLSGAVEVREGAENLLIVPLGKPLVVVDTREASKMGKLVASLRSAGCEVREERLEAGDFYVPGEPSFLVERKTPVDLVSSVRDGRLWRELDKMKSSGLVSYLLVEGPLSLIERFTDWSQSSVAGLLVSVSDGWGVPVLWAPSQPWTVSYLLSMARRARREEKRSYPLRVVPKRAEPREAMLAVVEGLPGVGPERAEALLKKFGTLSALFSASAEELEQVEGVGEKTARRLEELFRLKFTAGNFPAKGF
jgi:ERCC4-type nuclease